VNAQIDALIKAVAHLESLCPLNELGYPGAGLADADQDRERHAALSSGTKSGPRDRVERVLLVGIGHEDAMVCGVISVLCNCEGSQVGGTLRGKIGDTTLAVGGRSVVDMLAHLIRTDKGYGLDERLVTVRAPSIYAKNS
jgi:hypothetical protein